jgi:5-methyltetrahydrofolate--homocysteine methyltransferase
MENRKMKVPLLIGGATTSRAHTAVKIAPAYSGPVVHVTDASRSVGVMGKLLSDNMKAAYIKEMREEYVRVREEHAALKQTISYLSLAEARANRLKTDWKKAAIAKPSFLGLKVLDDYPLETLTQYIDWSPFFQTWELNGKYPEIFEHKVIGKQARELFDDAQKMLKEIVKKKVLKARAVVGLYPAAAVEDDVEIYADESRRQVLKVFHMLRQQSIRPGHPNLALSDYVAPKDSGVKDYMGFFACTSGAGLDAPVKHFEKEGDDYSAILMKALADRLAEAFAEHLHERVRKEFWGYAPNESCTNDELIHLKYRGIRPAPGYPACPEHTEKRLMFDLLQAEKNAGVSLTESFAMLPASSVSGYYFAHPESRYFSVGKLEKDQIEDYARRKGMSVAEVERWLSPYLAYAGI